MKNYKTMQETERTEWLSQFGIFLDNDYSLIKAKNEGWKEAFRRGLSLLEKFTISERFVRESLTYMDFDRRVKRLCYFIEEIRKQVVQAEGDVLARAAGPKYKRRAGRPTAESRAEERRAMEQQEADARKLEALSVVSGTPITTPKNNASKPPVTKPQTENIPDLFNQHSEEIINPRSSTAPTYHFQDLKHLLPHELQEQVESVAMLRGRAANESELAKMLAQKGAPTEEIASHTRAAADCTDTYMSIYEKVDRALATLYIATRANMSAVIAGETHDSQLAKTKPYYERVKDEDPTFEGKTLLELQKKAEENMTLSPEGKPMSKADKAALLHKYRTFFMRKDTRHTQRRLEKMQEIISYLQSIGESTDEYIQIYNQEKAALS